MSAIASAVSACRRATSSASAEGTSACASSSPCGVAVTFASRPTSAGNSSASRARSSTPRVYEHRAGGLTRRLRCAPEPVHVVGAAGEPPFQNTWATFGTGDLGAVSFYKDREGIVLLSTRDRPRLR